MNTRNWKMMALAFGLLFAAQACALYVDDDDYGYPRYRHHHGYWRWQHSTLQQPDQPLHHDFLAQNMLGGQEALR
jgi:hypothetical protein